MTASIRPTAAPARPLSVRNVRIRYPDAAAAAPADVSFDVAPGEVVLLLGPSGCGKSTLSLAFNGLIPHALPADIEGGIDVGGIRTTASTVAQLSTQVAMVFQDPDAQLVTGTVLDEVAFGPENLRLPVDEVLRRTEDALRRVGLWERREHNPERLSGGGRQRLAIACALAMAAPLLVLDEPTANLDPAGIEDVYAALADIVAAGDRSIVLVEHNLDQAVGLVDRVVVLDAAGRVVADGDVDAVLRARADELHALGVWLPASALAALRLRAAGYALDPLPLTPAELRGALEATTPAPRARTLAPQEDSSAPALLAPRESPRPVPGYGRGQPRGDEGTAEPCEHEGTAEPRGHEGTAEPCEHEGTAEPCGHEGAEPLIRVRGLTVIRRRREILRGIDLEVRAGEFLAIVGANGAGKTTLAQAIAGVVPPPRGRVSVAGVDPARVDVATLARTIGFVFQNPEHQFVTHTVFDELAQGLRLRGTSDDEVHARVADMLERFGLTGREQTHPFLLSGGQKRRLSVGTALIAGAPIVVLDEPTFGQDRARADELLAMLRDLNEGGATVIVVTHDMQLVAEYATSTAVLADGELLTHAPTPHVFADTVLVTTAGLRIPPLAEAFRDLASHPALEGAVRLRDLPDGRDAA